MEQVQLNLNEVIDLYCNKKYSLRKVSKICNCAPSTLSKFLKNNNVQIRSGYDKLYYGYRQRKNMPEKYLDQYGYISYKNHKREHRLVMEEFLNRKLLSTEYVHHIDFNKQNNDINNLFLFKDNAMHRYYHAYILKNDYISPQNFIITQSQKIKDIINYDFLYENYILLDKSINEIYNNNNKIVSRKAITSWLKKYGIYYLKEPIVNQWSIRLK